MVLGDFSRLKRTFYKISEDGQTHVGGGEVVESSNLQTPLREDERERGR